MKLSFTRLILVMALLALASGLSPARAGSFNFTASQGSGDSALSAFATVTTGAGQVIVTLTNTLAPSALRSAGQGLSDFSFTLSNAPGTTTLTGTASGQFGNVAGTTPGVVTFVSTDVKTGNTTPTRWLTSPNAGISGNIVTLEAIGGGQPSQMIAPLVLNGGSYANSNASVTNFNAWVIGSATFTLTLPSVTANTTITATNFSFGTGPDTNVPGTPTTNPIPEPSTLAVALVGIGMVSLSLVRKRRRS